MTKDEILVIRINARISPEYEEELKNSIIEQKETGVVVLPYFAEAIIAPKDVEIKIEEDKEGCWLAHKDGKCYIAHGMYENRIWCDNCGFIKVITGQEKNYNFCPRCGAIVESEE